MGKIGSVVFLLGAGASRGCSGAVDPGFGPPPLGDELFGRLRVAAISGQRGMSAAWATQAPSRFAAGFESGLAAVLSEDAGVRAMPLMRDLARYLWWLDLEAENTLAEFVKMAKRAAREPVFSTLNYDLLLERALDQTGCGFDYNGGDAGCALFKLHGSINWVNTMTAQVGSISHTEVRGGEVRPVRSKQEFERSLLNNEMGAVMSLYEPGKSVLLSPDVILRIQHWWAATVAAADAVVCIGARWVPHDQHVWEPIRSSRASLIIVDPDPGAFALFVASRSSAAGPFTPIEAGFADSLPALEDVLRRCG